MTEFTAEFIEEQRKIIRNGTMTALQMKGNNEIDLHINRMYRRAKQEHCEKYYPEALDHIERQAQRIVELEAKLDLHKTNRRLLNRDLGFAHERIAELEIQLKSKDIIINNQQGRLNYYATKDLLEGKNE